MILLTAQQLRCGYVERYGEHVALRHESSCYHITRHPDAGHCYLTCCMLVNARQIARQLQRTAKEPI